ncbi:MAG: GGDEF domain-containing phosphodiesterase [Pseudomonadota bacterium]
MLRHRLADVLTGPLALAILPVTLLTWNAMGAQIGLLVALIALATLAVLAAIADRHLRQDRIATTVKRASDSGETFDIALRSALYHARLRETSVLCMVIELNTPPPQDTQDPQDPQDPKTWAERTYHNAMLIKSFLRRRDQVSILGRTRFGVVINAGPDVSDEDALTLARRLKVDIEQASAKRVTSSVGIVDALIGVCLSNDTAAASANDVIRAANKAVQAARGSYAPDVQLKSARRTEDDTRTGILLRDIVPALEGEEFCAWFQPQICAETSRVTGFESLARWKHPTEGMISPCKFLPLLQRRGLMSLLQDRMLQQALDGFEAWRKVADDPPAVGINLSPEDLQDPTLPDRIQWELDHRDIAPSYLNVEILETVVARTEGDMTTQNIQRLSDIGCRVDLDDFGTGHASISSLQQFALNRLKIDRSFVSGIEDNPNQENMVAAILTMAKQLGLDTLAEGVETEGQQSRLSRLGCGHLQGYAIARPMPLDEALQWLAERQANANPPKIRRAQAG